MSLKESHEKNDNSSVQRRDKKVEKGSAQTLNPRTIKECSGRDLNPRLRLERPEYLTGLYYRSTDRQIYGFGIMHLPAGFV
jgi:hypothetical protein